MRNTKINRNNRRIVRRGFSLIEVIVAVTIIAIFAALVAPNLLGRLTSAKQDQAQIKASQIAQCVKIYLTETRDSSLGSDFDLTVLVPKYLETSDDLMDPWGMPYQIAVPGNGREFDVYSYGADKAPGGTGDGADIFHGKDPKKAQQS
ncbi:MAG: type II secretion system protein GspG [Limnohabitans sp.]|jgi:general secretion pathway protein G|nr:type II secretion system protein GspG [Limnohabitans sp.]